MTSAAQIAANRANAKRSTGPRTEAGKAAAAGNAVQHGLTAAHVLLPDESVEEFERFREEMLADLAPNSALQNVLASRIISASWRLRRVDRVRADVMSSGMNSGALSSDLIINPERLGLIVRYEIALSRELHKCMKELRDMQAES